MKRLLKNLAVPVVVAACASFATGQVRVRDVDGGNGRAAPSKRERIDNAIKSMKDRAVLPTQGELGENGQWVPPATEAVTFMSDEAPDFGASLNVALVFADSAANATVVGGLILPDPRIVTVTSINTTAVTPTTAELQAFDAILVWSNLTFQNSVLLGDNVANYVDSGGGCVLSMFAMRANIATRTLQGRFLTDNYYCITQSVGANITGPATLGAILESGHELLDGVVSFDGGTSSFRTSTAPVANAVRVANWSTGEVLIAERNDYVGGRVDLGFFCVPAPSSPNSWNQATDGHMLIIDALAVASKQTLWQTVVSQAPFQTTNNYRNSNLPGVSTFSDQQWADDFTIAGGAIITDLALWAVYTNTTSTQEPPPPLQSFTVRIFADAAGVPGALVYTDAGSTTSFRNTGVDNGIRRVYEFGLSLNVPFIAQPGVKYWISPLGNTAGKTWAWNSAAGAGTSAIRTGDAGAWSATTPGAMTMVLYADSFRFGGTTDTFNFASAVRGNYISVDQPQVLDSFNMQLTLPANTTMWTYVFEANTTAGPFTPIYTDSALYAGGLGQFFYGSGRMHATLVPGKVYIVGFGWNAAVDFYRSPGQPSSWPLGSRFGSGGINGAVNPVAGAQAFIGPLAATEYSMRMSFSITGCYADCDGVGGLTGNDFQCFLDAFVAGKPYANCDGVGGLTGNDFQCFLDKFVAGCP